MNTHVMRADAQTAAPKFLTKAWYVAALSSELGPTDLFHRTLLDTTILFYRKADGTPVAMVDRCPHRFAPLHAGARHGDEIVCPYHGLRFDATGRCTLSPHGTGAVPRAAKVRTFPLLERHGFVWIWMSDDEPDPALMPDYGPLDEGPDTGIGRVYMYLKANYELIIDNVMDLSHVDHVHGEIISTRGALSPIVPALSEDDHTVSARWDWKQTPPMGIFAPFLPAPQAEARHFAAVQWSQPANIQLSVGATQDDGAKLDLAETVGQYDLHVCTPETATTTHYWFATRRNHNVDDADFNAFKTKAMHDAFVLEDFPLIEAAGQEMEKMGSLDFLALAPVLISSDAAPVKVRRLLKSLIERE